MTMKELIKPHAIKYAAALEEDLEYEDDDGLGYYSDGEKRTLTDEQIAIFRHSELQALLRKIAAGDLQVNLPIDQPQPRVETPLESRGDNVKQITDIQSSQDMDISDESVHLNPDVIQADDELKVPSVQLDDSPRAASVQPSQQGQVPKSRTKRSSRRWKKLKRRHQELQAQHLEESVMGTRHDPTDFVDEDQDDERTFRRKARELDDGLVAQTKIDVDYG